MGISMQMARKIWTLRVQSRRASSPPASAPNTTKACKRHCYHYLVKPTLAVPKDTRLMTDSGKGKPILTEAERLLRREETARKRKRQSEQKRQDEQDQTINRLLRAQTSRTRNKLEDPTAESSPAPWASRRVLPPSSDMIRWTSSLMDDRVVMRVAAPEGKEDWIAVTSAQNTEQPRATIGVAPCGVQGCSEKRKYRSVKEFNSGGCSLEHLKLFEASLPTTA